MFPLANEEKYHDVLQPIADAFVGMKHVSFFEHRGNLYNFVVATVEKPLIEYTLKKTNGNQVRTAKILGMNRNTLHAKIKKLNIDVRKFKP